MSSNVDENLIKFYNCKLLRNSRIITEDLWVRNGKIVDPEKVFYDEKVTAKRTINCNGAIISPGYIELQINGGFGVDFSHNIDNVEEGIQKVAKELLSHGVTSFCPTLVTSSAETYRNVLPRISKQNGGPHGATILGVHLEGPFISPDKKGAHQENLIQRFDQGFQTLLDVYKTIDNVCLITLAPELARSNEVTRELTRRNVKVSVGHSIASLKEGEDAVKSGASFITHLFNAMLPFHHRDPGLVGLLTSDQVPPGRTVYFGIIADGIHTHPAALRIAHRTHPQGLVLVTDAVSALGLPNGLHRLGQLDIEIKSGRAIIANTNTLCGSVASMPECVRFFKQASGCSVVEALEAATLHPAQALEIHKQKGVLDFKADADFIMLDDDLNVLSTWIAGECVYTLPNSFNQH